MNRHLPVKIQAKLNGSGERKNSRFGWHNTSYQSLHHITILRPLLRSFLEKPCPISCESFPVDTQLHPVYTFPVKKQLLIKNWT